MGVLEIVMQMKKEGKSDYQISDNLMQEGYSPKEINEAMSQSRIKNALNDSPQSQGDFSPPNEYQDMQPSLMQPSYQDAQPGQMQEMPSYYKPSTIPAPSPNQESYQADYSYQYPEYAPEASGASMETMNEIADQLVEEKISSFKKQLSQLDRFKEEIALDVEKISERLQRIENNMNELQMAVIGKIGEYGKDINNISKEMHMTQESFSKILNPLTDNIREMQKITEKDTPSRPKPSPQTKGKSEKPGFEDYLR